MTAPTSSPAIYASPKRKRSQLDLPTIRSSIPQYSPNLTPSGSRETSDVNTKLNSYFPEPSAVSHDDPAGSGSPRSVVAGQLGDLDIHGDFVRRLDFGEAANKRVRRREDLEGSQEVDGLDCNRATSGKSDGQELSEDAADLGTVKDERTTPEMEKAVGNGHEGLETPLASESTVSKDPVSVPDTTTPLLIPPPPPPNTPSKAKQKPPPRTRSPPLQHSSPEDIEIDPLTWHDSEITGHLANPATDPDDDGYGINGIGFRPSAAVAYQRKMKRKQQVKDWMKREQDIERRTRGERRRAGGLGTGHVLNADGNVPDAAEIAAVEARDGSPGRKGVRFLEDIGSQ